MYIHVSGGVHVYDVIDNYAVLIIYDDVYETATYGFFQVPLDSPHAASSLVSLYARE